MPHTTAAVAAFADDAGLDPAIAGTVAALREQHARNSRQLAAITGWLAATTRPDGGGSAAPAVVRHLGVDEPAPPIRVRCLGGFDLDVGGWPLEGCWLGRVRALFQYLLLHRSRLTGRDTLIEALWPDPDALAAGSSLKVAVHALRQGLREIPGLAVVAQDAGYQLRAPALWLDVEAFERLCRLGRQLDANGQAAAAEPVYRQAAELYAGELLPEVWADWVLVRRENLKDQFLGALARLTDAAQAAGDWHACIGWCLRILEQDSCREDAFRLLMACHGQLGQPGRVRRWFEVCQRMLRSQLDCEPAPETVRLYEAALRGGPPPSTPLQAALAHR